MAENSDLFSSMHSVLASSGAILILSGFSESTGCIHKFALVPKEDTSKITHMVLLLLADRDSVFFQYPYSSSIESRFDTPNEDTELMLKESLSLCPNEVNYDPSVHPNGLLDFQKNELISKCVPSTSMKTQSDDRSSTETKSRNKSHSESTRGQPQSTAGSLPLTSTVDQRRKSSSHTSSTSSDMGQRKSSPRSSSKTSFNRHSMTTLQTQSKTQQHSKRSMATSPDSEFMEVIEDFYEPG
jgi:hypothetical protein